jgi:hypothetical protein
MAMDEKDLVVLEGFMLLNIKVWKNLKNIYSYFWMSLPNLKEKFLINVSII